MNPERPKVPPEQLYPRRLASRALGLALDALGMQAIALKLMADDPSQCLPGYLPNEVSFYEDFRAGAGKVIATVLLIDGTKGRVIVERLHRLVRRNHLRDFHLEELGLHPGHGEPDLDVEVDLSEVIERDGEWMRTAPQRDVPPPSRRYYRPPNVIRAFGSSEDGK